MIFQIIPSSFSAYVVYSSFNLITQSLYYLLLFDVLLFLAIIFHIYLILITSSYFSFVLFSFCAPSPCPLLCFSSLSPSFYFVLLLQGQAANTANRRVLVTDKNGKQSVQCVNDELGINGKDMAEEKRRLERQGVDTGVGTVEMYGGMDSRDKPVSFRRGVATKTYNNAGNTTFLPCCCTILYDTIIYYTILYYTIRY